MATKQQTKTDTPKPARYFVLNPAGAIHEVTKEHAALLFRNPGYRKPSTEQVKAYLSAKMQVHDAPIGQPWSADPGEGIDVESLGMEVPNDEAT